MKRILFMLVATCLLAGMANAWTAYNDAVYDPGRENTFTDPQGQQVHYTSPNVTYFDIGNGHLHASSGELIDKATGAGTGVTVSITQAGGVIWQPSTGGTGGYDPASGTDAWNTFNGIVDMTGVTYYASSPGWWVEYEFSGLDPAMEYTFAGSAVRNGSGSAYTNRVSIFTISGADTYTNASTTGVTDLGGGSVQFNTGMNYTEGYVARWTGITAADGVFKLHVTHAPTAESGRKAYAFDVFALTEIPEPMTITMLGLGGLALLRRRKR